MYIGVWRTATVHSLKQQWAQESGELCWGFTNICPVQYSIQYVHVRTTWCKKDEQNQYLTSLCQYV